jgi:hypothetical protein
MTSHAESLLTRKAVIAMEQVAQRLADLRLFEQILLRQSHGENLGNEITGWNSVNIKDRTKLLKNLINKCKDDLANGYWSFKTKLIKTKVNQEFTQADFLPRYKVNYTIKTEVGDVVAKIDVINTKINIEFITKACKGVREEVAIKSASEVLLIGMLS